MSVKSVVVFLCLGMTLGSAPGWANISSGDQEETTFQTPAVEGQIQLESQKECPLEPPKQEECPTTFGPIITDTAIPIDQGLFAIQPTFGLSFVTNSLTQSWRRMSAGGDFKTYSMDWKFTYGLWNNLEVFVVIPYVHNWAGSVNEPGPQGECFADFGGLGDINLTFKYRLVEETETRPTVTGLFATDFPVGHYNYVNPGRLGTDELGGGVYAFTTGINLSKWVKPFIFYANIWYTMQTACDSREDRTHLFLDINGNLVESDPVPTQIRNYPRDFITLNLAAEYPLTGKWVALLELTSFWDAGRIFGHKANLPAAALVSVLPGIEYMATEKFSLALGLNIDLVGKNTDTAITPILSMVYAF